ncbi:MAG: glycosyl hydrolase [Bacteroidota bacterium]|nr:glycosyl hydrolase [Bacteroidota bacterium]
MKLLLLAVSLTLFRSAVIGQEQPHAGASAPRKIVVDLSKKSGALRPVWAQFGYDEPNFTYMKDGAKLLGELASLSPVPVYVRCHNLLTTGDGKPALKWGSTNAYTEDADGRPVYDWHIVDSIFGTYIKRKMRPLVEIGFMPEALSTHPQPYRHSWRPGVQYDSVYTGWAWPPTDYKKWEELVFRWVSHCVQRYGAAEVNTWLWEVWNEPNISYWKGTMEEYFSLYDHAVAAVRRALPAARVGGPATTGPGGTKAATWLQDFLAHCADGRNAATGGKGAPLDFISFHAKGSPKWVNGHVRMNMLPQLNDVARGFEIVKASSFSTLPVYITECDPEGCAACGMTTNPENAYRNGTMYSSYTAASFTRIYDLAARYGIDLAGLTSWSFEFEGQKWFDGFRDLATNGVDKPVLNVFRMYGMMLGDRVQVDDPAGLSLDSLMRSGVHGAQPDIHALAAAGKKAATVMVWNYHDDDLPGEDAPVELTVTHIPGSSVWVQHYRIDEGHSNAYQAWKKMGSPQSPTEDQFRILEQSGQLQQLDKPKKIAAPDGTARVLFSLPRHGISLLRLTYLL